MLLVPIDFVCPVCGQLNDSVADTSQGDAQRYVEDCQVCCRPLILEVRVEGERATVVAEAESP